MLYSNLFSRTLKEAPKDVETVSHKYLTRAGFIDQLMSGVYTYLPMGWRVHQRIANIIRDEMNALSAQEIFMPALQKKSQWLESGRWDRIDPPLFIFKDRHGKELALGPTHEEVVTDLARRIISSYKDLPVSVYQIQNKFRNEMRATGGLLRVREFMMKDMYSFHADEKDFDRFYKEVIKAYFNIFSRCGLTNVKLLEADSGTIGGKNSHEFGVPCEDGEDKMVVCEKCDWAANAEVVGLNVKECPKCKSPIRIMNNIENGHIFMLGAKYSDPMKAYFTDKDGSRKPLIMGCYGIGIGRLMATVVEQNHDDTGIIWPKSLAPFDYYLTYVEGEVRNKSYETYKSLSGKYEVLFDDREGVNVGEKFADCDLLGVPTRLVVSKKSLEKGGVEVKDRKSGKISYEKI